MEQQRNYERRYFKMFYKRYLFRGTICSEITNRISDFPKKIKNAP